MARLKPTIGWAISGRAGAHDVALDSRLPALVAAAARRGTLAAAARDLGLSYRAAWGLVEEAARLVGEPLLVLSRGKGAALAPLGERLLAAHRAATARVSQDPLSVPLHPAANRRVRAATLKVAASHDIALAQLRDRWRLVNGVALDFLGSGASLSAYASGAAEVAGFHVAPLPRGGLDPLLARLDPARDALIRFLRREQGLIVARGNPRRVKGVADIATKRLTFVNRQPGSGTRLLLDRLLARKRIDRGLHERGVHACRRRGDHRGGSSRCRLRHRRRGCAVRARVRAARARALPVRVPSPPGRESAHRGIPRVARK